MPRYSIVVPAYNEARYLPDTLAALRTAMAEQPLPGELILCDNDSTDDTAQLAADAGATVVHEPHRQIARARNAGAAAATGDYLIFVDADTTISSDLLRQALDHLQSDRIAYGGTTVAFPPDTPRDIVRYANLWNWLSRTFTWACGAFVFTRRDAFFKVGGFDERYYASEEIHLSKRLKKWARRHDRKGLILDTPIVTSARKADWFTRRRMLFMLIRFALWPPRARSREECWLWYQRPDEDG